MSWKHSYLFEEGTETKVTYGRKDGDSKSSESCAKEMVLGIKPVKNGKK